MVNLDPKFKKQFKLSFIKSIEQGFSVRDIKKNLKKQAYPKDLIENLIEEFQSDKEVLRLLTPEKEEKPSFFQNLKNKLFKVGESKKIQIITKIHSLYYNFVITEKRKLNEKSSQLEDLSRALGNKKLISDFAKEQVSWSKELQKRVNNIVKTAKSLVNADLDEKTKQDINKILEYVQLERQRLDKEIETMQNLSYLTKYPEELRMTISKEKTQTKRKERELQDKVEEISKKSDKFKEVISEL